jgi:hypothetical protein
MIGAYPLAHRPLASAAKTPRAWQSAPTSGEFGWAAWSFSRQAKLNAWGWHGLGSSSGLFAWATLGNCMYVRRDSDSLVHVMKPDTYLAAGVASSDSGSVEATTQWLDFGKPGKVKALTGIDADCRNVHTIEVYISEGGAREGTLAESIPIGDNNGGWTYNGEMIPLAVAATEFMVRFVGDPNTEVQVNRLTLHWDDISI